MRNPFKRQPRPSDKRSLRERLAATRERLPPIFQPRPSAAPEPAVSPELSARIADCLYLTDAVRDLPDDALKLASSRETTRRAGEARAAVALFPSGTPADTWAKSRCLSRIYHRGVLIEEVAGYATGGSICLDGFALALAGEVMDLTDKAGASALPVPQHDPVFAAIQACRDAIEAGEDYTITRARDDLLQIVPTTTAGCAALARYAGEFFASQGRNLEDADGAVLDLIARSPAL